MDVGNISYTRLGKTVVNNKNHYEDARLLESKGKYNFSRCYFKIVVGQYVIRWYAGYLIKLEVQF